MTDLLLVRHAETIWHRENRYAGRTDVALTQEGREQAKRLGQWAAAAGISAVWTSPLGRCLLTAEPAVTRIGCPLTADERLLELDFGALEGKTKTEAHAIFASAMDAYLHDPVANCFPDGELPGNAAARAVACLHDIAAAHPQQRVMVVGHSTLTRLALCNVLGIGLGEYRRRFPVLLNCAVTQLRLHSREASLVTLNLSLECLEARGRDAVL
jgi:broad specificity phosphatase PhoE